MRHVALCDARVVVRHHRVTVPRHDASVGEGTVATDARQCRDRGRGGTQKRLCREPENIAVEDVSIVQLRQKLRHVARQGARSDVHDVVRHRRVTVPRHDAEVGEGTAATDARQCRDHCRGLG